MNITRESAASTAGVRTTTLNTPPPLGNHLEGGCTAGTGSEGNLFGSNAFLQSLLRAWARPLGLLGTSGQSGVSSS